MEKLIYDLLIENLEVVAVKDGGGNTTAIALKHTTLEDSQFKEDIELAAKNLAKEITDKLNEK